MKFRSTFLDWPRACIVFEFEGAAFKARRSQTLERSTLGYIETWTCFGKVERFS
jgi:hypothetical protein